MKRIIGVHWLPKDSYGNLIRLIIRSNPETVGLGVNEDHKYTGGIVDDFFDPLALQLAIDLRSDGRSVVPLCDTESDFLWRAYGKGWGFFRGPDAAYASIEAEIEHLVQQRGWAAANGFYRAVNRVQNLIELCTDACRVRSLAAQVPIGQDWMAVIIANEEALLENTLQAQPDVAVVRGQHLSALEYRLPGYQAINFPRQMNL
ncbi:MAG: hypothetical protein ABH879_04070 [archaeon]